ncbi:MAG TPA: hypothetical protein PLY87_15150 [Planctomycetaceae bacterium]|nr:hypothetical protein [Planctomycetaceae bacterium]HQZ66425.1 hypothetical protein [Planctomycetaceae bacterium]
MKNPCVLLITLFTYVSAIAAQAADDHQFTAPGPQLPEVVAFIEEIISGYDKSSKELANLQVSGTVMSFFDVEFPDKVSPAVAEVPPNANRLPFLLVQRSGLGRYEQEYFARSNDPTSRATAHRLKANDGFYKLDGKILYISPRTNASDEEDTWADLNGTVLQLEQVFEGKRYVPLVMGCRSLISQLNGEQSDNKWDPAVRMLVCRREGSVMTVSKVEGDSVPPERGGYTFSFSVDSSKGYRLIETKRHAGGEGRGLNYSEVTHFNVHEFFPGVFHSKTGVRYVSETGNVSKKEGHRRASRTDFIVDNLVIGDLDYDESRFTMASLPIPKGTMVEDLRIDPPLTYKIPE